MYQIVFDKFYFILLVYGILVDYLANLPDVAKDKLENILYDDA